MACGCERTGSSVVVVGLQKSASSSVLEESGATADWSKEDITEVSEGKLPPQSPINLLKTLLKELVRERERERKRRAEHTFLPGGASLRSQLILAGGVAQSWRYIVRLPNHLIRW